MNPPEQPRLIGGVTTGLIGVVTHAARAGDVAVLIPPAPGQARTGAHRLHVRLARDLALAGLPSLRFDAADGGDSPPGAGPAARHDGDLEAASAHLRALHPGASIAIVAFRNAAMPVVRALPVLQSASVPLSAVCLIDPTLDDMRPIESGTWWNRLIGRSTPAADETDETPRKRSSDESAWLALPKTVRRGGTALYLVVGHDRYAHMVVRNYFDEDRSWHRALQGGEGLWHAEGADAAYSRPETWRALTTWVARQLLRGGRVRGRR